MIDLMSHDSAAPVRVVQVTPTSRSSFLGCLFGFLLVISVLANFVLLAVVVSLNSLPSFSSLTSTDDDSSGVIEHFQSGNAQSVDKVAIVDIEGVLMEGLTAFAQKQIEHAAKDSQVKAVVLRISSPGGSITASDHLHHQLLELRDGSTLHGTAGKPIIVSMGSMAASGGYYIAMPGQRIFAERTTMTGSIGVYAALPNVKELGDKVGFHMDVIKAGEVKDSGSPFAQMSEKERMLWQHLVDESYLQFIRVVEDGRPNLKGKLQEDVRIDETVPVRTAKGPDKKVAYTRYRADGGIYTAPEALKVGLIDQIGYLDDAVAAAAKAANLGAAFKAVRYERPATILGSIFGIKAPPSVPRLDFSALANSATPRLWYLTAGAEPAGILAAAGKE